MGPGDAVVQTREDGERGGDRVCQEASESLCGHLSIPTSISSLFHLPLPPESGSILSPSSGKEKANRSLSLPPITPVYSVILLSLGAVQPVLDPLVPLVRRDLNKGDGDQEAASSSGGEGTGILWPMGG